MVSLVVLAGCAAQDGETGPPPPGSYTLTLRDMPERVDPGEDFNFTLSVAGTRAYAANHIGAHWSHNVTDAPSTTTLEQACIHEEGQLPGDFTVRCNMPRIGPVHLRGHVNAGGNYWSDGATLEVRPLEEPTILLNATGVPSNATANESFTFNLAATGALAWSDHVGAHYGNESTEAPSTTVYGSTCVHQKAATPATVEVTCTIPDAGTYHLRGHVRVTVGDTAWNYWADEQTITVT